MVMHHSPVPHFVLVHPFLMFYQSVIPVVTSVLEVGADMHLVLMVYLCSGSGC